MARVTQQQIADHVGVSGAAVSLALSGRDDTTISADMREKILRAADDLGYTPRARLVRPQQSSGLIGYVVPAPDKSEYLSADSHPHQHYIHHSAMALLEATGRHLLTVSGALSRSVTDILDRVDGLIVTAEENEERLAYYQSLLPTVVLNYLPRRSPMDAVAVNECAGIMAVVQHLYDLGHRRIGLFGLLPGHFPVVQRIAGFRQALTTLSLPVEEAYIMLPTLPANSAWAVLGTECAYQAMRAWRALSEPPTAIVTVGDTTAFRLLQAAHDLGVSVPADISVTGYDDLALCQLTNPPLTTVRQPSMEVAQAGVKLLMERMENRERPAQQVLIAPQLIVRGSTQSTATP